jgi:hypothetical protein
MISLLFLFSFAVHADPPVANVWTRYPAAVSKVLPKGKYHLLDSRDEEREWQEQGYLPPQKRDALFNKVKIADKIAPLDAMAKDMLVMRAKFESLDRFRRLYPMLKVAELKALIAEVQAMK